MSDWKKNIDQIAKEAFEEQLPVPPAYIKAAVTKSLFGTRMYWLIGIFSLLLVAGLSIGYFMSKDFNNKKFVVSNMTHTVNTDINSDISRAYLSTTNPREDKKNKSYHSLSENDSNATQNKDYTRTELAGRTYVSGDAPKNESDHLATSNASLSKRRSTKNDPSIESDKKNKESIQTKTKPSSSDKNDIVQEFLEHTTDKKEASPEWLSKIETSLIDKNADNSGKSETGSAESKNDAGAPQDEKNELGSNEDKSELELSTRKDTEATELSEAEINQLRKLEIEALKKELDKDLFSVEFNNQKARLLHPRWELNAGIGIGIGTQGNFITNSNATNSILSAPSYEFGFNTRVFLKDWHVSTGLNVKVNQFKENFVNFESTQIQTGTTMVIDTILPNPQDTTGNVEYDTTFVPTYSESITEENKTILHKLSTISIPLKFGYRFRFQKFHLFVGAGVQLNIPTSANSKVLSGDSYEFAYSSVKTSPYNSVNAQLLLETEFHYRFNDKWSASLRPSYRYQLSPVFKSDALFRRNKHSGFLSLGIHYYF